MLIWRFPYCCLLPVGGVGVNCNVWGWTLILIHWGRTGPVVTPRQACLCQRPIILGPLLRQCLLLIGEGVKKRNPGNQFPLLLLLLLLFGVAHTLFPLWRSYSCRGVCVGLPLIHRSSFTFWETRGWVSNWHQAFFFNECSAQHPAGLSLCCL